MVEFKKYTLLYKCYVALGVTVKERVIIICLCSMYHRNTLIVNVLTFH